MAVQLLSSKPADNGMTEVVLFEDNTRVRGLVQTSLLGSASEYLVFRAMVDGERQRLAKARDRLATEPREQP